jgi:hypothetical protein
MIAGTNYRTNAMEHSPILKWNHNNTRAKHGNGRSTKKRAINEPNTFVLVAVKNFRCNLFCGTDGAVTINLTQTPLKAGI